MAASSTRHIEPLLPAAAGNDIDVAVLTTASVHSSSEVTHEVSLASSTTVAAHPSSGAWRFGRVAVRSASTGSVVAEPQTGVVISKPAGVVTGDVLYAFLSKTNAADTNTFTCSGWTGLLNAGSATENDRQITILRKVITNGGGEASTYTFVTTSGTISNMAGIIVRVGGANVATPEDVLLTPGHRVFDVNDSTPASPDMTTVTDDALVLQWCLLSLGTTVPYTWGAPSGYLQDSGAYVQELSGSSDQQAGVAVKTQFTAGAVGTNVWTHTPNNASADYTVAVISIRAAAEAIVRRERVGSPRAAIARMIR